MTTADTDGVIRNARGVADLLESKPDLGPIASITARSDGVDLQLSFSADLGVMTMLLRRWHDFLDNPTIERGDATAAHGGRYHLNVYVRGTRNGTRNGTRLQAYAGYWGTDQAALALTVAEHWKDLT